MVMLLKSCVSWKGLSRGSGHSFETRRREVRDESVKLWLQELKAISYQADDLLDEYQYELLRLQVEEKNIAAAEARRSSGGEGKSTTAARISGKRKSAGDHEVCISTTPLIPSEHLLPLLPDDMLDRIKKIRESFVEIDREWEALNLRDLGQRRDDHDHNKPPPTSSFVDESGVFGRDDDKENLIESLFSDMGKKLSVIPIVGMGGLGKTTLAQLVYNDSRVRQYFDSTAWVCVSTDFDVTRLTKAITQALRMGQYYFDSNELDMLQRALHNTMQEKKVLVVLDDVWSDDQTSWELLQKPFGSAKMVRIIVTTRKDSVARIMQQPGSYSCRPCILSEEQSWLLFKRRVFVDGGFIKETQYLVDIGKQIIKKCAGLPLAVKAIGGVLLCEREESRWGDILDSPIWDEIGTQILPVLKLSYDRMPSYLKPCFSLCSMFPKDYHIQKDMLIKLWVGNGYIQGRESKTMQDIGEDYVNELCQRSVIQNSFYSDLEIIMHDMVLDVALSVSDDECCVVVLDTEVDKCPEISSKVRHLFVEIQRSYSSGELMQILSWKEPIYLRSLVYIDRRAELECEDIFNKFCSLRALVLIHFGAFDITSTKESNLTCRLLKHLRYLKLSTRLEMMLPESIFNFYNLQILDVPGFHGKDFPDNIGNLINLQYLKSGEFARFPESMGDLINLQYFESGYSRFPISKDEIFPQAITKLVNLRHLLYHTDHPLTLPLGIGNLTNLRTLLPGFRVGSDQKRHNSGIRELKTLEKLRGHLIIYDLENVTCADDAKAANLACKPGLEILSLKWSYRHRTSFDDEGLDFAVLENLRPHTNLKELDIYGYKGCRLPSWLGDPSFCKLTSISLYCPNIIHDFGMLSQLTSLTSLKVSGGSLCSLEDTMHDCQLIASSPSLESLTINGIMLCWQRWNVVVMEKDFPRLTSITIKNCPNLWRLPSFQSQSLVSLELFGCYNLRVLTVHRDAASPSSLKKLHIGEYCSRLEMIEGLRFLTSLETLKIFKCPLLQIPSHDCLPIMPLDVEICDGVHFIKGKHWCSVHGHNYNQFYRK